MFEKRPRAVLALLLSTGTALAQAPTPGYPERVLQWTVKNSETCDQIAEALYGSARYRGLVERYNSLRCAEGQPLRDGTTLVVPEKPTELPTARLSSLHPEVRTRPPGGAWADASPGMPLYEKHSVNTLEKARADILFADRTRVVLAEHTLVVIYDTAKSTAVAHILPSVELETGEVQAGLAALGGKPFELGAQGGRVTGASRDVALRSRANRATVSVFDGSAKVSSAGKGVDVPKNHGTSFRRAAPPAPPRPLPPAPRLNASSSENRLLAEPERAVVVAGWEPVPNTARYRIELARDAEFTDLILREEVPASVRAFRGEKLPKGEYFLRVRAIDNDDFLGIASQTRVVRVRSPELVDGRETPRRRADRSRELSADSGARALRRRATGISFPIVPASPLTNVAWWAPSRPNAVGAGAVGYLEDSRFGAQLQAHGSGSLGAFGLDMLMTTPAILGPAADGSAWFKLSFSSLRSSGGAFELGPAAELGIPLSTTSPAARAGLGVAFRSAFERWSLILNVGGRARLADDAQRLPSPSAQGYLLAGATYEALDWLAAYALLDAHLVDHPDADALAGRGGLTLGSEVGRSVFATGALRASPWPDAGGTLTGQITFGIRDSR